MTRLPEGGAPLRLVLDTNIVISGTLWNGAPRALLSMAGRDDGVSLFTSVALLAELRNTLSYPKFTKRLAGAGMSIEGVVALYRGLAVTTAAPFVSGLVPRDPKDDAVVAAALGARAHAIVSGDKDLTELETVSGIVVLRAAEAVELIGARAARN